MKTISQVKDDQQKRLSAIFDKFGIIFAFSNQQFSKNKKEGVTYVNGLVGGMLIPEKNVADFLAAFNQHSDDCAKEMRELFNMYVYIHYELANHEAWYTGSISEAYPIVKDIYPSCTKEDMWRVWHKVNNERKE